MGRRKSKNKKKRGRESLPRGSGGILCELGKSWNVWHDLDVPLFRESSSSSSRNVRENKLLSFSKENKLLAVRLQQTGFSVMALSHMVYGKVDTDKDSADVAVPSSCLPLAAVEEKGNGTTKITKKVNDKKPIVILRRLNVVIEEASQLSHFTTGSAMEESLEVLSSYDLIALSPRNDAAFSAACSSTAHAMADIITLDYTAGRGGVQLPYKLKKSDVKTALANGITFELAYGPAIVDVAKRKALIQTAMQLHSVTMGTNKPKIILSSGSRHFNGKDHSAMALRTPGDLINLLVTILGFHQNSSSIGSIRAADTLCQFPKATLIKAKHRQNNYRNSTTTNNSLVSVQFETTHNHNTPKHENRPLAIGSINDLFRQNLYKKPKYNKSKELCTASEKTTDPNPNSKATSDQISHDDDNDRRLFHQDGIDEDENDDTEEGFIRL